MYKLIEILRQFDVKRSEAIKDGEFINKSEQEKYEVIAECFKPCAENILCNGYFLVNGKYIIDLGAIELYYHEEGEESQIKDYIMYHIKDKVKSKIKQFENELPYFEFGSFNLHQSGVDVTFENPKEKYRASFLIRSYRVLKTDNGMYPKNDDTKFDSHSTHIFDDMFYNGISFNGQNEIIWIPTDKKEFKIKQEPEARVNVAVYVKPYVKDNKVYDSTELITQNDYNNDNKKYIKINGKFYKRDTRKWQFKLDNISEE